MENENNESNLNEHDQDLQIENEILKLKMMAELGAWFSESADDLPPEVEAEFLKNVQLFEDSFENSEEISIYEFIGRPEYKDVNKLNEKEVEDETERLAEILLSKNIVLDVLGRYEPGVIYKFITDELFNEKIRKINIPDFVRHFIYEEFHPNHVLDIGDAAQRFLNDWFEKGFNEDSPELADLFITEEGKIYTKQDVLIKLTNCLDSYNQFSNVRFKENHIGFEWNDKEERGLGHAEGIFSYDAEIENGEIIHIEGRCTLFMINEYGRWEICYFVFPGFAW